MPLLFWDIYNVLLALFVKKKKKDPFSPSVVCRHLFLFSCCVFAQIIIFHFEISASFSNKIKLVLNEYKITHIFYVHFSSELLGQYISNNFPDLINREFLKVNCLFVWLFHVIIFSCLYPEAWFMWCAVAIFLMLNFIIKSNVTCYFVFQ